MTAGIMIVTIREAISRLPAKESLPFRNKTYPVPMSKNIMRVCSATILTVSMMTVPFFFTFIYLFKFKL